MSLKVGLFYRLHSGSVGSYLGTRKGLRCFRVGGREILVSLDKVEARIAPARVVAIAASERRIPMKAESKRPTSCRRTKWASTRPGRRATAKNGNARNSGGACVCGDCRLKG